MNEFKKRKTVRTILVKISRTIGWLIFSILVLLVGVIIALRIPSVQNYVAHKAIAWLHDKIHTRVELESIYIDFPKTIVVKGLYLEDQKQDTLLYAGRLAVDAGMMALLKNEINLNSVVLENSTAVINRTLPDSAFNFDYIIDAFAPADTVATPVDTTAAPLKFSLGAVEVTNVKLRYNDEVSQMYVAGNIGELETDADEFDPIELVFLFDDIILRNSNIRIAMNSVPEVQQDSSINTTSAAADSTFNLRAGFNRAELSKVNLNYSDTGAGQELSVKLGEAAVDMESFNLDKQEVRLENVVITNTFVSFHQAADSTENAKPVVEAGTQHLAAGPFSLSPWHVTLSKLDMKDNTIDYQVFGAPSTELPFDPNRIWLMGLNISATDIEVDTTSAKINLASLSFRERKGIEIPALSGNVALSNQQLTFEDFSLAFRNSRLNAEGEISYPSLDALMADPTVASGSLKVSETAIYADDVLLFQPHLLDSIPVILPKNAHVDVNFIAKGSFEGVEVDRFEVNAFDSTRLFVKGTIGNLNKPETALINVKDFTVHSSRKDIVSILPDTLLPETFSLPKFIKLNATAKGTIQKPTLNAILTTDNSILKADADLDMTDSIPTYAAKIYADDLKLGPMIGQPALGDLSFNFNAKGRGFTMEDMNTQVDLVVSEIVYNAYRFTNFNLHGTLKQYFFSGVAALDDKNLDFELNADLDYNNNTPVYKATLDLKNLDLKELNLSERPLRARFTIDANLTTSDFQVMNGNLDIRKVAVFNGTKLYAVDSMLFASLDQEGKSEMSIRSDIIDADFGGSFNIFSISDVLSHHFGQYFNSTGEKAQKEKKDTPQNFKFDVRIKNTDLLTEVLVPELEPFTPGMIRGSFDSQTDMLDLALRMPKLQYNTIGVDSLLVLVNSNPNELRYLLRLDYLKADTITIDQVNLNGRVAHDSIHTAFNILDSLFATKYAMGADITRDSSMLKIHLDDNELVLNYGPWNVPEDNYLGLGEKFIVANNFEIQKTGQKVRMIGDTRKDPAITVQFEDLELGNLTRIISGVVPASGELNGDFKFTTGSSAKEFSSKLSIAGLTVLQKPLGDVTLGIQHSANQYNLAFNLRGNQTSLEMKGTYGGAAGNEELNIVADINQLNIQAIEPFSFGQLKDTEGLLKGQITVKGKTSHPDIAGSVAFTDVSFIATYLNNRFNLKNESIAIKNDNISLNNFTISDEQGNTAQLKGNINITEYTDPKFDLTLVTKNFQVLNTVQGDNELFYGKVKINTTTRVTGSATLPKANVKLGFSDDTNLTYVVPSSEKGVMEAKGIIKWVDRDAQSDPFLSSLNMSDTIHTAFTGIEVAATIDLNEKQIVNIIIDPITGDQLSVQGNSSLTFDMSSSGNMNMSGRYELSKGSYNLSFYNIVKRKFDIEKGSTITWSGDPLNAEMDIRASNLVETSPIDLLATQSNDPSRTADFNQRLPFLVYLNIKGQLLAPVISFQLDMPADKRNAMGGILYSKLQDINTRESDLNKQVFALLILRRFVADNPFESQAGGGVNSAARTSVSRVLSDQLNRLSENIKGVQLSFDIKSYEQVQGGEAQGRTSAQLGVSKSLLNDRLVVKLSGNVDIEGQDTQQQNSVTDYIGDLALEYKMTEDGRFRITGFRNSNYDMIDGELTETGAGLIYIKDYNTLRELFKSNEKTSPQ